MTNFEIKGMLNHHLQLDSDESNLTNNDNTKIYSQILEGKYSSLAYEYLLNLGYMRLNDAKSIGMYNQMNLAANINKHRQYEEIKDDYTINLPPKLIKIKKSIMSVMEQRHSSRNFCSSKMKIDELSTILKYSFGLSKRVVNYNGVISTTRYHGSGGGLYPINIYLLINNVKNIKKGLYRYQPYSHSLYPVTEKMNIVKLLQYGNFDFENYSFAVLYEYDINRNYLKYGELSLLTTLVEIGIISHNFELTCASLDFSACQIAGFDKQYAEKCIGIDGINSHILFTNICGKE